MRVKKRGTAGSPDMESLLMLPEQIRLEEAITAASQALSASRDVDGRRVNADLLVALIRARDPDVTRRLEAARLMRVGL